MKVIPFPQERSCCEKKDSPADRVVLPVASRLQGLIRFTDGRKRPQVMMPNAAIDYLESITSKSGTRFVELDGPGDPLADPDLTMEILQQAKRVFPELKYGLTTLGLNGNRYASKLSKQGLNKITLLMDAVDEEVVKNLYAWIRPGKKTIPLSESAVMLLEEQVEAIKAFIEAGVNVHVKTTVYPGYNDEHIEQIAQKAAQLGVDSMALVSFHPADEKQDIQATSKELMTKVKEKAAKHIQIIDHDEYQELSDSSVQVMLEHAVPKPTKERPNLAVVSSNGMDVDLHLGQAIKILIYGPRDDGLACLLETRDAPEPGSGGSRWEKLADILSDCFALLTASAGDNPRKILNSRGISVLITENEIEGTVDVLYGGGKKGKGRKK